MERDEEEDVLFVDLCKESPPYLLIGYGDYGDHQIAVPLEDVPLLLLLVEEAMSTK